MSERIVFGYQALLKGALRAGCTFFCGYPVTPQNEVTEAFSRGMPEAGGVYLHTYSEAGSVQMLYGAGAAGVRAMSSTSGPGWSLMQEGMSQAVQGEVPFVVVDCLRGGPGGGSIRHAQMDWWSITRGGGHGGYHNIALASASVQELYDHIQLAFYLADKYRNPVIMMPDAIIVAMADTLKEKTLDFGPLPPKDWAVRGMAKHSDGKGRYVTALTGTPHYPNYLSWVKSHEIKYQKMREAEVRYESLDTEGADLILVAYGYVALVCKDVLAMAHSEGLRVGLIRPITAWPFPYQPIREKARPGCQFLVVEDSQGQMVEDVRLAVEGRAKVSLVDMFVRHDPSQMGMIRQDKVFEAVKGLLGKK